MGALSSSSATYQQALPFIFMLFMMVSSLHSVKKESHDPKIFVAERDVQH